MNRTRMTANLLCIFALIITHPSVAIADNENAKRESNMIKERQSYTLISPYGEEFAYPYPPQVFDSTDWKRRRKSGLWYLSEQFYDFVRKKPLIGMTREQVIELLGNPDETDSDTFRYRLRKGKTDSGIECAELGFTGGSVSRYRLTGIIRPGCDAWITENITTKTKSNNSAK